MNDVAPGHVVVVGASLAGLRACESARREGFTGKLTLVGAEEHLPYDRPPLSKAFLQDDPMPEVPRLPAASTLADALEVDLRLGRPATGLDVEGHRLLIGETEVSYDALLLATGASPRRLPGSEHLAGVHTLRTLEDACAVRAALKRGAKTVVVGAGFIGSEVASAARKRGLPVTIVEAQPTPLVRAVGYRAGEALASLHHRNDTDLRCDVGVEALQGSGSIESVRLTDGTELAADLVVVGIGAAPATGWLEGSSLTLDDGVVCDEQLRAGPEVYAAGDVARWLSPDFDVVLRLEHWTNAAEQAARAIRNLLDPGTATAYHHVPYFWSDWYGSRIQFAGLPLGEPVVVAGWWDTDAFTALYRHGDRLIGVLTLNRRADIMKYRGLIARQASWQDGLNLAASRNAVLTRARG
ncbi:FAD-dependent oxidoreductase [Amycolatopsis acidiphila]|uniref:Oxidoreductase n=1 Tax=Amycolatopsis acidiphila TaxID=715473 RepID=A0A558A114_9PSEU|nr:FAD-dependent oxidoreductase [Amycolatopsis acidiphila]TVT17947.1 oxidoreductase [Amycolatopsis acidiphila]UIJ57850.1 FAD-dependent oxidoreductase [Amycolatopsis acidiphila]GHG71415.1 pyridine nucleotide-disulfide oxidoreductase [Amycolatopsis acidiphila]